MKNTTQILGLALMITFTLMTNSINAQPPSHIEDGREHIEAMKTAFLTRKMQLTKEEAREFWPVYDKYQEKMLPLIQERRTKSGSMIEILATMKDEEINDLIDERLSNAEQILALRKQQINDLRKILPPSKIFIFIEAEQQFNRELQQRINQRKDDRPNFKR
jgi:Spy/CpxP family protein refolding chaperone